jgi:hypothetical protein
LLAEETFFLSVYALRTFQQPNPFCNSSTTNLWIFLWLAETSQQPISQPDNLAEGHPPL